MRIDDHTYKTFYNMSLELNGWYGGFYRLDDIQGLEKMDKMFGSRLQKFYYSGSSKDMTPVIVLDNAQEFYYQDVEDLVFPIEKALEYLEDRKIVKNLRKSDYMNKEVNCPKFDFSINNISKRLLVFEESDVIVNLIPQIKDVDFIYGYNSLITEEMLKKAKTNCLIFSHPGFGMDEYKITKRQRKKFNLKRIKTPNNSIFRFSKTYKKLK